MFLYQMLTAFIMLLPWQKVMAEMNDEDFNSTSIGPTSTELSILDPVEPCTSTIEEDPYRCPAIGYGPSYCSKDCRLACKNPLIAYVPNESITASSSYNNALPKYSRLHTGRTNLHFGGWMPGANGYSWIQVNLGSVKRIHSVATQGCEDWNKWVTRYRINYRRPEHRPFSSFFLSGTETDFEGNFDTDTIVVNKLINEFNPEGLLAQYVRLYPTKWFRGIGLRWELYSSICDPEQVKCPPEESYLCPDQTCQKNRWRCGGYYCTVSTFWCAATESCVPDYMICDGRSDCPNGKDELNCPVKPTVGHDDASSKDDGPVIWPIGVGVLVVALAVIAVIGKWRRQQRALRVEFNSTEYSTRTHSDNRTQNSAANNAIPPQPSAPPRQDGNQQTNIPQRHTGLRSYGINTDDTPVNNDNAPVDTCNTSQLPPPSYDEVIASPTQYKIT